MDTDNSLLSDSDRLRIGRLIFDGADPANVAKRYGVAVEAIDAAWVFCREELSKYFAMASGESFRLFNDEELVKRRLETLRLLLDWRQALLDQQRTSSFTGQTDTD